jgi:hypothetical protein
MLAALRRSQGAYCKFIPQSSSLTPLTSLRGGRRRRGGVFDEERNAGLRFGVEGDVDGIKAGQVEFQLLERDDEVACPEMGIARQHDFRREIDSGHDEFPVGIHEIEAQFVGAFVLMAEGDAQGDGALRVRGGNLLGDDRVKRAEQVQLAVFFRGGVAENSNLNIHPAELSTKSANLARISLAGLVGES